VASQDALPVPAGPIRVSNTRSSQEGCWRFTSRLISDMNTSSLPMVGLPGLPQSGRRVLWTGPEYSESEVVAAAPTSKSGKTQFPLGPPRTDLRGGADCTV